MRSFSQLRNIFPQEDTFIISDRPMLPDGVASASNQAWNEDDYDDEIFEEKPAKSSLFRSALFPLIPGPGNLIHSTGNDRYSGKNGQGFLFHYRQWTHVRTYGTDVFAMDMLSLISQASGDELMKPMAFYCVFILVLRRLLPDF